MKKLLIGILTLTVLSAFADVPTVEKFEQYSKGVKVFLRYDKAVTVAEFLLIPYIQTWSKKIECTSNNGIMTAKVTIEHKVKASQVEAAVSSGKFQDS